MAMSPTPPLPPLDPLPALKHVTSVADEACFLAGDKSANVRVIKAFERVLILTVTQKNTWYGKRAAVSAAYGAAGMSIVFFFLSCLVDDIRLRRVAPAQFTKHCRGIPG